MELSEKITALFSRRSPAADMGSSTERPATSQPTVRPAPPRFSSTAPELADRRYLAELRRYEVETDEIVASIRDKDERRKNDRVDQWIFFCLIVVAAIALLVTDQGQWSPYLPPALVTGAFFKLIWAAGRRNGSPDSS